MRAVQWLLVLGVTGFLGAIVGVWVFDLVSNCSGQQCVGGAMTGFVIGGTVGIIVGVALMLAMEAHELD